MQLTRQVFELIAQVLASTKPDPSRFEADQAHANVVFAFVDKLAETNPSFDKSRFIAVATGLEKGKGVST